MKDIIIFRGLYFFLFFMWDMNTNIRVLGFDTLLYAVAVFSDVRWSKCNLRQTTIKASQRCHILFHWLHIILLFQSTGPTLTSAVVVEL